MNKKVRNLRKSLRNSKRQRQSGEQQLSQRITELNKEVSDLRRKLTSAEYDRSRAERDYAEGTKAFKELECFRVAVAGCGPFRHSSACDIYNVSMQIDMRAFEYGMFRASRDRMMPMCKLLDMVRHDLTRNVMRQIEGYMKEKGLHPVY